MSIDLNRFDDEKFETDEDYQEEVRATPVGIACEIMATSMTLQDCGEFIALAAPELLVKYFRWAEKQYKELDIDPQEAVRLVRQAVADDDLGIEKP